MPPAAVLVPVGLLSAVLAWSVWPWIALHSPQGPGPGPDGHQSRDLIVVLDGGAVRLQQAKRYRQQALHHQPPAARRLEPEQLLIRCRRTPPPAHPMPELLQGYDTATQITALADWLRRRPAPHPQRLWIATDPDHTARATLLAHITLVGRGIEIQPDPPPPPSPGERRKLLRDVLRLTLWRATGCSGLWKDLEFCSIPVVDGPAGRSG